jgi:hypothetical protein
MCESRNWSDLGWNPFAMFILSVDLGNKLLLRIASCRIWSKILKVKKQNVKNNIILVASKYNLIEILKVGKQNFKNNDMLNRKILRVGK